MGVDGAAFYDYSNLLLRDDGDFKGLKLSDIQTAPIEDVMSPVVHCIAPERPHFFFVLAQPKTSKANNSSSTTYTLYTRYCDCC